MIGPHRLEIRNLSKRYGEHVAVDGVSITVERGRFVTLLGPSGSGKTTVLMTVAGFVEPTSGQVLVDGKDITRLPPERRRFGMVFQGYALFPTMTVEENVWFPLRVRGIRQGDAAKTVKACLDLVQMGHLAHRAPADLSGGQQQRVALARALVFEPDLLLLDEPLSALDRQLRADLQWELRSLHRRLGATFINVTHDQEEALSMSDEIVILRDGRVEQAGSPGDLYRRPANRFVASFLGDSNFISGRVTATDADRVRFTAGGDTTLIQSRPSSGTTGAANTITVALRPEKVRISAGKPDTANAVRGAVEDSKYQGSTFHVHVRTEQLGTFMVKVPGGQDGLDLSPERPVWLGWDPDAAVVLAGEP